MADLSYQSLKTTLTARRDAFAQELQSQDAAVDKWMELSERTFNFARYARIWFKQGDTEVKRAVFNALGSNLLLKDKKLAVNLHPVFQTLVENIEKAESELEVVRTQGNGLTTGEHPTTWVYCPALRRRREFLLQVKIYYCTNARFVPDSLGFLVSLCSKKPSGLGRPLTVLAEPRACSVASHPHASKVVCSLSSAKKKPPGRRYFVLAETCR